MHKLVEFLRDITGRICQKQVSKTMHKLLKGDLLCKNHFYKLFEHSCVAAVCENNQPIMLKIHQLIFL